MLCWVSGETQEADLIDDLGGDHLRGVGVGCDRMGSAGHGAAKDQNRGDRGLRRGVARGDPRPQRSYRHDYLASPRKRRTTQAAW